MLKAQPGQARLPLAGILVWGFEGGAETEILSPFGDYTAVIPPSTIKSTPVM
jgi:hypothetical protein